MRHRLGIAVLLAACALGLASEAARTGLTVDEPSHFAAASAWWLGDDTLTPADTPPLTRILSGWVPLLLRAPRPDQSNQWRTHDAYAIGREILGRTDIRSRRLLFYTRLTFIPFALGVVLLIWLWARELFGGGIALILAACGALEPTILGHGALIKSDVPATCMALAVAFAAWKYWRGPSIRSLLWLTLAATLGALTKFTLLPLFALAYGLALWKGPRLIAAIGMPLVLYGTILATGQFDVQPVPAAELARFPAAGIPGWALPAATLIAKIPWPLQFVRGLLFVGASVHSGNLTGYMLGHRITGWHPGYFPLAWGVKFPIPLQLLTVAGFAALVLRIARREARSADFLIWGLAAFFSLSAISSNLNIGFRHMLPALPFLILGGGFALNRWKRVPAFRVASAAAFIWLAIGSVRVYPQGIAFFNEFAGGPAGGWRYLADSNIDWGQNLPDLALYLNRHRIPEMHVLLFTFDNLAFYPSSTVLEPVPWPADNAPASLRLHPDPGYYALSVNFLTGYLMQPQHENFLADFRSLTPIGRAGYSILIYRVK